LGAAKDLESNIFATRAEAIRAIQEIESRGGGGNAASLWAALNPVRRGLGKLLAVWFSALFALIAVFFFSFSIFCGGALLGVFAGHGRLSRNPVRLCCETAMADGKLCAADGVRRRLRPAGDRGQR